MAMAAAMASDTGSVITRKMPLSSRSKATFAGGGEILSTGSWYAQPLTVAFDLLDANRSRFFPRVWQRERF